MTLQPPPLMLDAMSRTGSFILKALAVLVAVVFALGVITLFADPFFGSSKIKPLFGMSAEALAGDPKRMTRNDGGPPTYFNATKSAPLPLPRPAPQTDGGPTQ